MQQIQLQKSYILTRFSLFMWALQVALLLSERRPTKFLFMQFPVWINSPS